MVLVRILDIEVNYAGTLRGKEEEIIEANMRNSQVQIGTRWLQAFLFDRGVWLHLMQTPEDGPTISDCSIESSKTGDPPALLGWLAKV